MENETRFSRKYQCESLESRKKGKMRYIVKLASLAICDSQTSKVIIHSEKLVLDSKFSQDSLKTPDSKLVMILASLAVKFLFARLSSLATKFFCETREKQVLVRKFFVEDW